MRPLVALILLGLLAVPFVAAQENATSNATGNSTDQTPTTPAPAPIDVNVQGHADGSDFYWTVEGASGHNPTLTYQPGQVVHFHVSSASGTHNFKVGDLKATAPFSEGDAAIDVEWTAPASGSATYICTIHGSAMSGKINVGAAPSGNGGGATPPTETPAPTSITVTAHVDGDQYYWTVEGLSGKNPTITVAPDADITVTIKSTSEGTPHNFEVESAGKASDYITSTSETVTYTFHSGAEGTSSAYFCVPHKGSGMKGTIKFAAKIVSGGSSGGSGDLTGNINGDSVDLGTVDPACQGTNIPAASANKEIGGPTTADYVQKCKDAKAGISGDAEARPPSNADYVIPASLVVIALGIVGVVWVHKFYKP